MVGITAAVHTTNNALLACKAISTFSKNALIGGSSALLNTSITTVSALISLNLLINRIPGDFYTNVFTVTAAGMGLSFILNRVVVFPAQVVATCKLGCDFDSLEKGGYIGSLLSLSTIFYRTSFFDMYINAAVSSFLMGALVSGVLASRRSVAKIN